MWSRGSQAIWLARCPQLGEGTRFGSLMKRVFLVVCVVSVDGRRLIQDGEQRERAAASLLDFESEAELSAPRVFVATMASLSPAAAFSAARAVRVRDHVPETGLGALPARARAAVLRRPRLCEEWPDGACVRRTLNSEVQSKSVRAAPATMVAGPKRVEIHATGKNLDSTPGGWVQEVLRNAQEFLLDQRANSTWFRTSDGARESEVTFWSIDEAIQSPGESKAKNIFEFSKHNFHFEDVEYLMRRNAANSSSEVDTIFQAASQFNALEMASPRFTPKRGVEIYDNDNTQGPEVAMAGGYATIYRNYGMDVSVHDCPNTVAGIDTDGQLTEQYNALQNVLDDAAKQKMQNGYFLPDRKWLAEQQGIPWESHPLRRLQVGVHPTVELTGRFATDEPRKYVGQVFASAFPIQYSGHGRAWGDLIATELTQAYLLTFLAALKSPKFVANAAPVRVYLTLLGGGAFGNPLETIIESIFAAAKLFEQRNDGLHIKVYINLSRKKELQQDVVDAAARAGFLAGE